MPGGHPPDPVFSRSSGSEEKRTGVSAHLGHDHPHLDRGPHPLIDGLRAEGAEHVRPGLEVFQLLTTEAVVVGTREDDVSGTVDPNGRSPEHRRGKVTRHDVEASGRGGGCHAGLRRAPQIEHPTGPVTGDEARRLDLPQIQFSLCRKVQGFAVEAMPRTHILGDERRKKRVSLGRQPGIDPEDLPEAMGTDGIHGEIDLQGRASLTLPREGWSEDAKEGGRGQEGHGGPESGIRLHGDHPSVEP